MSDSNRVRMQYQVESTYGAPLGTGSATQEIRFTGESLAPVLRSVVSDEIRPDGRTADVLRAGFGVEGAINCELSYLSHFQLMNSLTRNTTMTSGSTATITATFAASGGTITRASGDFTTDFTAGGWVRVAGAVNSANNGVFKITAVSTTVLTVVGGTLVNETSTASVTCKPAQVGTDGTTQVSMSIEKEFVDNTTDFERITGAIVDSWTLNVPVDGIITQSFGIRAQDLTSQTATMGNGTITAVPNSPPPITAVAGVHKALDGYSALNLISATVEYRNNLRAQEVMGTEGPVSMGFGRKEITGTIEAYYNAASLAVIAKAIAAGSFTPSSLAFVFKDTSGNYEIREFPAIKYVGAERIASGPSQDVRARLRWQAYYSSTAYELCQFRHGRIAA